MDLIWPGPAAAAAGGGGDDQWTNANAGNHYDYGDHGGMDSHRARPWRAAAAAGGAGEGHAAADGAGKGNHYSYDGMNSNRPGPAAAAADWSAGNGKWNQWTNADAGDGHGNDHDYEYDAVAVDSNWHWPRSAAAASDWSQKKDSDWSQYAAKSDSSAGNGKWTNDTTDNYGSAAGKRKWSQMDEGGDGKDGKWTNDTDWSAGSSGDGTVNKYWSESTARGQWVNVEAAGSFYFMDVWPESEESNCVRSGVYVEVPRPKLRLNMAVPPKPKPPIFPPPHYLIQARDKAEKH